MLKTISRATQQTQRANKTQSVRRVVAVGYASSEEAQRLLESVNFIDESLADVMFSLCTLKLQHNGLLELPHVKEALRPFSEKYSISPIESIQFTVLQ